MEKNGKRFKTNLENGEEPFDDRIIKAHKMLKDMYTYNYNTDFNDETSLKTPATIQKLIDRNNEYKP
tara:strand:+ start:1413 stop:1613 length:201 start_codon:yes stop_codon:yes gene_type:complete